MVSYAAAAYCPVLEPSGGFRKSEVGLLGTGALLAMVEERLKLALVKEIFSSLLFPPQHLLSPGPSRHSFTAVG